MADDDEPEPAGLLRSWPTDEALTATAFDLFEGDNLAGRKDFISENGYRYLDIADVS